MSSSTVFTFHYASTLSILGKDEFGEWIEFTFHYASTLSGHELRYKPIPVTFTFHYASTLSFLTILIVAVSALIYIPLCFYFIRAWVDYSGKFETNLHSTMLLLYPTVTAVNVAEGYDLHSTMLLLYRDSPV